MKVRNLNNNKVAKFVGGDMEIKYKDNQNKNEIYLYRGRIKSVNISDNVFLVKFAWLAKKEGDKWVKEDKFASRCFTRNLNLYQISKSHDQITLKPFYSKEIVNLFLPTNVSNLDPAKVEGLK